MQSVSNVTVSSGQSVSSTVQLDPNVVPVGIVFPAAFDGSTVSFQTSYDGGATWVPISDHNGAVVTCPVVANTVVALDPGVFHAVGGLLRLSCSSQSADRVLRVAVARAS